jgi:DNA-binding FadR family transcriptional regulator
MAGSVKLGTPPAHEALSPAHTLLFGPLGSTDVASAVVHRLRAAIGLGLLPDGERLPKEADLASQLGITTFALREALAELRKQGLIQTRAGKYGGSFVTHSARGEEVEHAELISLSSAELRDLGDWRRMISGQSAALAAVRGSTANVKTLRSYAERVGSATGSLEARRGHGRFHLELASAAQSKRLTRAEFSVHEQIDWLFGLALSSAEDRETTSRELAEVAEAVARRKPELARERAERQVGRLVSRLAQLRLEVLATSHPKPPRKGSSLQTEIRALTKGIAGELGTIAAEAAPALEGGMSFQEARTRVSLAVLQRFEAFPAFVKGVGVITEVGVIPDQPYWIQWWLRTENGPVEDNHHVTDPNHEDFYDYQNMEIMTRPRETGAPAAHGPYVDYGGVDDYIITVSAPIVLGGRFLGISLVDILVADLESWLAPWLADGQAHVLLNSDNRVIVSNTVRYGVGEVLSDTNGDEVTAFPQFGWTLVTSAARD